eukprot:604642-Prorocentrum_minimum.AAC.1
MCPSTFCTACQLFSHAEKAMTALRTNPAFFAITKSSEASFPRKLPRAILPVGDRTTAVPRSGCLSSLRGGRKRRLGEATLGAIRESTAGAMRLTLGAFRESTAGATGLTLGAIRESTAGATG